jgi:hypothetical protein
MNAILSQEKSQMLNLIRRVVQAHKDVRLLSSAKHHIRAPFETEVLRRRLGLPNVSGSDLPAIVTSGDFSNAEGQGLEAALRAAIDGRSKLPVTIRAIKGMSGQRYRTLINTLIEVFDRPRYLEIGSWPGSTVAAAIYGNSVHALCIDNWSEFSGTKEQFLTNIEKATSSSTVLHLIEQDFREVHYGALGKFNVFLFDGPHSEVDHRDGILVVQPCLADRFVLIVDDWNWLNVRIGTMRGLLAAKCRVESSVQVRTTNDNTHPSLAFEASDWHNGYFIAVVCKPR